MKRALRFGFPIVLLAALIVAGVLLATTPWSSEEAAGSTVKYRLCDTVVEGPLLQGPIKGAKDIVQVGRGIDLTETNDLKPFLEVKVIVPSSGEPSSVSIDPTSATVLEERYSSPAHEAALSAVLNTVRLEPLDPATAPWPYTEASQLSSEPTQQGAFAFREPDPASGILVSLTRGTGDRSHVHMLRVANCRSTMEISAVFRTGTQPDELTVTKDVHSEDEAAFQTFQDAVVVKGLEQ